MILRLAATLTTVAIQVDQLAYKLPLYRLPRDMVLDTLLGPAENFDYVSTTAPSSPPPTRS